jgi:gamma-glutamylcyclotransferase (GGCT)/AIG2-like uncharacterized protein YtfP
MIGRDSLAYRYVHLLGQVPPDPSKDGTDLGCKLFAYGSLRPGFRPPNTMCNIVEDYIEGNITEEGEYPVLHVVPGCGNWIPGVTMTISSLELPALDKYEGDEYERIETITYNEHTVFVYVGCKPPM